MQINEDIFRFHSNPIRIQKALQLAIEQSKLDDQPSLKALIKTGIVKPKQLAMARNSSQNSKLVAEGVRLNAQAQVINKL